MGRQIEMSGGGVMKKSIGAKTIVYPAPIFVVGTYDKDGKPNVMTAAWGGICCSKPPCVAVSLRKATYTYGNIMGQHAFTVNIPSQEHVKEADYFGLVSGKSRDKFADTGLTPVKSDRVNAPYVKEFPMVLECQVLRTHELGLHTQFVGEIIDVKVDEMTVEEDGVPDIEKVRPIVFAPEGLGYFGVGQYLGKAFSIGKQLMSL
jgi:flavin reductase (DIM6/NTAB) family NADH-FMN oxidoreductase RutF